MKPHSAPRKTHRKKSSWPVSYRWLAAGAIAMYTAIGVSTMNVAMALSPEAAQTADPSNIPPRRYDIPAGLMGAALDAFQERSGVHVTLPLAGIRGLSSPGVSGFYTPQQAIEQLLKDTGVINHFSGQEAVTGGPGQGRARGEGD